MKLLQNQKTVIFISMLLAASNLFSGGGQPAYDPDYTNIYPNLHTFNPSAPVWPGDQTSKTPIGNTYTSHATQYSKDDLIVGGSLIGACAVAGLSYSIKEAYVHRKCLLENKPCANCKLLILKRKQLEKRLAMLHTEIESLFLNEAESHSFELENLTRELNYLTIQLNALEKPQTIARPFIASPLALAKGIKAVTNKLVVQPYRKWAALTVDDKVLLATLTATTAGCSWLLYSTSTPRSQF
jgi:hypothetical protein